MKTLGHHFLSEEQVCGQNSINNPCDCKFLHSIFYPECCALIGCPVDLSYFAAKRLVERGFSSTQPDRTKQTCVWPKSRLHWWFWTRLLRSKKPKKGKWQPSRKVESFYLVGRNFRRLLVLFLAFVWWSVKVKPSFGQSQMWPQITQLSPLCEGECVCVCTWLVSIHLWAKVFPRELLLFSLLPSLLPSLYLCYLLQTSLRFRLRVSFHGRHIS